MRLRNELKKVIRHPGDAWSYGLALARGFYYKLIFRLLRKKVKIGRSFRVRGRLTVKGPGAVIIGDGVLIDGRGHPVTPFTYHPDAVIRIGDDVFLNGTRMGCRLRIDIQDHCIIADARILDTDFHGILPEERRNAAAVLHKPVSIGQNVWIGMAVIILKGVHIGYNSVIGTGSVVTRDVPENSIAIGNPAHVVARFNSSGVIPQSVHA